MRNAILKRCMGKGVVPLSLGKHAILILFARFLVKCVENYAEALPEHELSSASSTTGYVAPNDSTEEQEDVNYRPPHSNVAAGRQDHHPTASHTLSLARGKDSVREVGPSHRYLKRPSPFAQTLTTSTLSSLSDSDSFWVPSRRSLTQRTTRMREDKKKTRASPPSKWSRFGLAVASFFATVGIANAINAADKYFSSSGPVLWSEILSYLGYVAGSLGLAGIAAYRSRPKEQKEPPPKRTRPGWRIKRLLLGMVGAGLGFVNWIREHQWIRNSTLDAVSSQRQKNVANIELLTWTALGSYFIYSARPNGAPTRTRKE